jgi:hypothetical protein
MAGKRGSRLGWRQEDGSKLYTRFIKHSDKGICWEDATEEDLPDKPAGRPAVDRSDDIMDELGDGLHGTEWQRKCLDRGISKSTFWRTVEELKKSHRVDKTPKGKWMAMMGRSNHDAP